MFTVPKGSLAALKLRGSFAWIHREGEDHLAFFPAPTPSPFCDQYHSYNSVCREKTPRNICLLVKKRQPKSASGFLYFNTR